MWETETLYCDNGHWFERKVVRGRKPRLCNYCKRQDNPVPVRRRHTPASNLVIHDGGKSAEGFGREQNDCSVRAVALACDVSYKEAYTFMARNGRKRNKGAYFHHVIARNAYSVFSKQVKPESFVPAKGIKTAMLRNPKIRRGTWILHSTHHVSVVKDGILMDSFDSSRKQFDGCWRVT